MRIRGWQPVQYKKYDKKMDFDGINTFNTPLEIGENQATDLRNVWSGKYPALKVRNGKTQIGSALTKCNGVGQRNNEYLHIVDNTTWKYWTGTTYTNVATGLTDATASFEEFSTGTTRYIIMSNGTERKAWDGSSVTDLTNAPNSKIFTTHKGRVYWARDNDIVYSDLNLINTYSGVGAGSLDVTRAKGAISSLYEYADRVWVWTESGMHGLYGTGPSNYELIDIEGDIGCISDRSVIVANKKLYWMAYDGVYEFDGSTPIKVSEPFGANGVFGGVTAFITGIKKSLRSGIVGGSIGDYLYMSIPYGASATGNNLTLGFDTKLRRWYVRDEGFIEFETVSNVLYGVDSSNKLWDMTTTATADGATAISWYYISKAFSEGSPSSQVTISELWLAFDLPVGSTLSVAYSSSVDNADFVDLYTFTASANEQSSRVIIPLSALQNVNWHRLKFYGTGDCTIHYYEKKGRIKQHSR